jgi:streptogramin lyase
VYVLDAPGAAVDAREPSTNELKTRILIGGAPTALALNEVANTVLVLDASQKRVTEIDAASNTVIGATSVAVTGTPTSISVDQGKIIVATVSIPKSTSESPSGSVAVINSSTKQLETVREINLAPRLVVADQRGGRSVVVSADATTLVDSSYKVLATLPGGVSAAFSRVGDVVAVLSPSGPDSVVNFTGGSAPLAVRLPGAPRAMASLPDGGYLVLVEAGGRGRVSKITRDGVVAGTVEVAVTGGDLVYDDATNRFAVANAGRVDYGEIPTQIAIVATPAPQSPSPLPGQSPTPSATATASPSAAGSSEAPAAGSGRPANANPTPNILEHARLVSSGIYNVALPKGVQPQMATVSGSRVWLIDQANGVDSFDTNTAEFVNFGTLRADAQPSFWVAGTSYVFAVDAGGQIHVVNIARGRVEAYSTNFPSPISAAAVGTDDRLWFGLRNASYLMAFDPRTLRMQEFDLAGATVSALAIDPQGRIFYADDQRGTVGTIDPRAPKLNEVGFAKSGTTTALMVDATSTLWVGTSRGEIYSVRGGRAELTVSLQRPVTAFAADQTGHAWYLAPLPSGLSGYAYGPADGSQTPRSVSGPALNLSFNPLGRAFLTDPQGGVYVSTEGGR